MAETGNEAERSIQLNRKQGVKIMAQAAGAFDQPLYAVNWLNLKRPVRYKWYSRLVFSHLVKVRARVFFKGYVTERLSGDPKYDREMLLLVCYPSPESFLKLISNKWFQVKSILRVTAISRFVFGYVKKRMGKGQPLDKPRPYQGGKTYMVLLFQGEQSDFDHKLFHDEHPAIELYFLGEQSAKIARVVDGKELLAPFFIDGIAIWQSGSLEALQQFAESEAFLSFAKASQENNVYLVRRTL